MDQQDYIPQEDVLPEAENTAPEQTGYQPRPMWQVWCARVGLVVFIILVIMSYILIARGGI